MNLSPPNNSLTLSLSPPKGERVPFRTSEGFRGSKRQRPVGSVLTLSNLQHARRVNMRLLRQIVKALLGETWPDDNYDLAFNLVSESEITRLNESFLRHKGSTDVITFDYSESAGEADLRCNEDKNPCRPKDTQDVRPAQLHGEVFICLEVAVLQARRFRVSWKTELVRYAVHGVLHLLGYDDQNVRCRRRMKRAEGTLLRRLARRFALHRLSAARSGVRS